MLTVKVLGPGCANCERLGTAAVEALQMLGANAAIEHVTDPAEFRRYHLMMTPGLVVNEKVVCAGRVPSASEVMSLIANVLAEEASRS
jgi:small redox-active disulfide protein 2